MEERINNTHDVARLTVGFFLHGKEGLATQLGAAGHADEAVDMEDLVHGCAAGTFAYYVLSAACAAACLETENGKLGTLSTHIKGQITYSSTHLHSVPTLQRLKWVLFRAAVMLLWHLSTFQTQRGQTRRILPRDTYYNYNVWMPAFTSQRSCYILAWNGFGLE